jgi:hypothetical protein
MSSSGVPSNGDVAVRSPDPGPILTTSRHTFPSVAVNRATKDIYVAWSIAA